MHYQHNENAWMTLQLLSFLFCKEYCKEKKIPFKILLILDNATGYFYFQWDFFKSITDIGGIAVHK